MFSRKVSVFVLTDEGKRVIVPYVTDAAQGCALFSGSDVGEPVFIIVS